MNFLQNSEHFTFLKFENRTNGSEDRVLLTNVDVNGNFQLFQYSGAQNVWGKIFLALFSLEKLSISYQIVDKTWNLQTTCADKLEPQIWSTDKITYYGPMGGGVCQEKNGAIIVWYQ